MSTDSSTQTTEPHCQECDFVSHLNDYFDSQCPITMSNLKRQEYGFSYTFNKKTVPDETYCLRSHYHADDPFYTTARYPQAGSSSSVSTQTNALQVDIPKFISHPRQNLYEACHAFLDRVRETVIKQGVYDSHFQRLLPLDPYQRRNLFRTGSCDLPTIFEASFDSKFTLREILLHEKYLEIFEKFQNLNYPLFQSTVMQSAYIDHYNKPFEFNWKRETSFMKSLKEQLIVNPFKYKLYWLYLEDYRGMPFATYASDARITAQIGVEVNVPQITELVTTINKLTEMFGSIVKPDILDTMKARVTALVLSLYNLVRWSVSRLSTQDFVVNLVGSLVTLFPTQKITDCFNTIFRSGKITAQSGIDVSSAAAIKVICVCVFLVITSQLPGKNTLDSFVSRVKNIPQALKSIGMFYEMIDPIAKECVLFVEEHVMKLDVSASRVKTIDDVTKFSERVAELTDMHKRRLISKDPALAKEAGKLHYDAVRLLGRCINMNYDRKSIEFLRSLLPTTYKLSESALASGADMNKIRRKPIVIWLAGQSQIGKTTLIMKLIQDIEKHSSTYFRDHGELPSDWEKEIFTCCPENEYMDGYHGQNWVTLDEFNQMRDSVSNPSAENFILLRAISQFPYLLHMAALHEKPNSYMSSHGFILTSNSTHIEPESIKTKEAITNRISCPYRMEVREEYRTYFDDNRKYRLNVNKVMAEFGGYTTDCYYFVEFDPYTERDLPGFYTYNQVLWRMIDAYDKETRAFCDYAAYLDTNRRQPLPNRDDNIEYTPPSSDLNTSEDECPKFVIRRKKNPAPAPPTQNNWTEEWKKPYTPRPTGLPFSRGPCSLENERLLERVNDPKYWTKHSKNSKAQNGYETEEEFEDCESYYIEDDLLMTSERDLKFDRRDYIETPLWLTPTIMVKDIFTAPLAATEEVLQRYDGVAKFVPTFVRRFLINNWEEYYARPRKYVKVFDHSAIQTEPYSKMISSLAQNSVYLSSEECDRVSKHIFSFRGWAINRIKTLKETAQFYLPGFMCTVVSAITVFGLCYLQFRKVQKQLNPRKDKNFQPKLLEAESCFLNGCDCDDCRNVDEEKYLPDFLFWNVPCKCYVDYCNKQSVSDKQRFIMVTTQSAPPTYAYHPKLRAQLASFANQCICNECPLCNGEECLCKGIARARGVDVGEDDLVDRVGAYAVMQKRLQDYADRQLQGDRSGPNQKTQPKNTVRVQGDRSGPNQKTQPKNTVRVQGDRSGPERNNKPKNTIRTQIEHSHTCKSCGRDYTHSHSLGVLGVDHRQYDYQCPYEDCQDYHKGFHNSRKLQFETVSCNHGNECTCPEQMNYAVAELWKSNKNNPDWKSITRRDLPEFVRYDEASETSQNCWDEFEGLTYVQAKRKLASLKEKLGITPEKEKEVLALRERQSARAHDVQAQDLIQNRLWPNILRMYVVQAGDDPDKIYKQIGHLLALGGNLFLTNYHFMLALKLYPNDDLVIRQGTIVWRRMKVSEFIHSYYRIDDKDVVVMKLDYKGNAFARITQHFLSKKHVFSHETQTLTLTRYSLSKQCQMFPNPITATNARLMTARIGVDVMKSSTRILETIVQPISWEYDAHTLAGDCGAPLVLLNSRIPEKIVGIHNAYSEDLAAAYGVPVYQEDVMKAIAHYGVNAQYGWGDLLPVDDLTLLNFTDGDNFRVVSVLRGTLPQASKTKLAHSPIFGQLTTTKTKPGYLRPFRNKNGDIVDPTLISRKKWGFHLPALDVSKVEMCDNYLSQLLCRETKKDRIEYRMPLTTEESIVGIPGVEGIPSMNKQSSPGYPFIFSKPPGRGKTGYFGQYEWKLDTPEAKIVLDAISTMEEKILEGNRPFVVSIDTLKDARIPIAKADSGKTRIFSAEPVDYCALHRKYFLPFIAHTMINRLDNSCAPGINAASPEFDHLAKLLRSKGNKVIAADYSQFDGRIPTEAIRSFYRAASDWYKLNWDLICEHKRNIICGRVLDFDGFSQFLERISFECLNHVHVCEKQNERGERFLVFYLVMNGQPSGNPGTAASNTGAGIWIIAYCYLTEVTPARNLYLDSFNDDIYICTYGDDMIMNVSDSLIEIFNQNVITEAMMTNFMLECTDEQKSSEVPPPYRSLSEVSFLKRSFLWNDELSMYVGVLPVDLLLDIANWVRTGAEDPYVITVDNLKTIAAELALHGREIFNGIVPLVREVHQNIARKAGKWIHFDTYESYLLRYRNGEYGEFDA